MKALLIKKETASGSNTVNVLQSYGIHTKHVPFILFPKVKDLYKQSWHDEDGDDEYLPENPSYESYEMKVDFVYNGEANTANDKIRQFLQFLQGGWLTLYDEYTGIGRQKVRYVSVDDDATLYRRTKDVVQFSVNFKVNDPATNVTL